VQTTSASNILDIFALQNGWKEQLTRLQMNYRDSQKSVGTAGTFE
jgi:hypothetical protein